MKIKLAIAALGTSLIAMTAPAQAQELAAQPYIGASVGYHDLGLDVEGIEDDAFIYGVVGGVGVPVGPTLTLGVEGNYHKGSGAIDSEYGVAGRLGFPIGTSSKVFVKGGYQWVDIDVEEIAGVPIAGIDDEEGDYLVGVGGEFGIGPNAALRVGVDTISFDSVRPTAGVVFKF